MKIVLTTNRLTFSTPTSLSVTEPIEAAATGMALARLDMMMASPETRRAVQHCRQDQYVNCDVYSRFRMSDGSCNNLQVSGTFEIRITSLNINDQT